MLYLVDGYNVTRSDPATRTLCLEEQREALLARLRVRGRDMLGAGRVVVVFDGQSGGAGTATGGASPVEVRFSRAESADDVIVRLASAASGPVRVVTSDSDLAERVRAHADTRGRVEVRGRETLFESSRGPGKRRGARGRYPASSAGIPAGGNRITEELKAVWLTSDDEDDSEE